MTLAQLRAFLAAMEHRTFTAAAEGLGVSQASISELVVRLEHELQVQLFVRGSRQLAPTAAAAELLAHARIAVGAAEGAASAMRSVTSLESGVATFGVLRNANFYGLSDLVQTFHDAYPGVRIRMIGLNSEAVAESVASGAIEAGLVVLPIRHSGLEIEPLFTDEVLYATSERPRDSDPVTIAELAQNSLILYDAHSGWEDPTRRQLLDRAQSAGLTLVPSIEVEHVETALSLVAQGAGGTIVSRSLLRAGRIPRSVRTFAFAEPFEETIALIKRQNSAVSPATRTITDLVRRTVTGPRRRRAPQSS